MGLNAYRLPFALLTFIALVMIMPALMYYVNTSMGDVRPTVQFLVTMVPVALAALALLSWLQPG